MTHAEPWRQRVPAGLGNGSKVHAAQARAGRDERKAARPSVELMLYLEGPGERQKSALRGTRGWLSPGRLSLVAV